MRVGRIDIASLPVFDLNLLGVVLEESIPLLELPESQLDMPPTEGWGAYYLRLFEQEHEGELTASNAIRYFGQRENDLYTLISDLYTDADYDQQERYDAMLDAVGERVRSSLIATLNEHMLLQQRYPKDSRTAYTRSLIDAARVRASALVDALTRSPSINTFIERSALPYTLSNQNTFTQETRDRITSIINEMPPYLCIDFIIARGKRFRDLSSHLPNYQSSFERIAYGLIRERLIKRETRDGADPLYAGVGLSVPEVRVGDALLGGFGWGDQNGFPEHYALDLENGVIQISVDTVPSEMLDRKERYPDARKVVFHALSAYAWPVRVAEYSTDPLNPGRDAFYGYIRNGMVVPSADIGPYITLTALFNTIGTVFLAESMLAIADERARDSLATLPGSIYAFSPLKPHIAKLMYRLQANGLSFHALVDAITNNVSGRVLLGTGNIRVFNEQPEQIEGVEHPNVVLNIKRQLNQLFTIQDVISLFRKGKSTLDAVGITQDIQEMIEQVLNDREVLTGAKGIIGTEFSVNGLWDQGLSERRIAKILGTSDFERPASSPSGGTMLTISPGDVAMPLTHPLNVVTQEEPKEKPPLILPPRDDEDPDSGGDSGIVVLDPDSGGGDISGGSGNVLPEIIEEGPQEAHDASLPIVLTHEFEQSTDVSLNDLSQFIIDKVIAHQDRLVEEIREWKKGNISLGEACERACATINNPIKDILQNLGFNAITVKDDETIIANAMRSDHKLIVDIGTSKSGLPQYILVAGDYPQFDYPYAEQEGRVWIVVGSAEQIRRVVVERLGGEWTEISDNYIQKNLNKIRPDIRKYPVKTVQYTEINVTGAIIVDAQHESSISDDEIVSANIARALTIASQRDNTKFRVTDGLNKFLVSQNLGYWNEDNIFVLKNLESTQFEPNTGSGSLTDAFSALTSLSALEDEIVEFGPFSNVLAQLTGDAVSDHALLQRVLSVYMDQVNEMRALFTDPSFYLSSTISAAQFLEYLKEISKDAGITLIHLDEPIREEDGDIYGAYDPLAAELSYVTLANALHEIFELMDLSAIVASDVVIHNDFNNAKEWHARLMTLAFFAHHGVDPQFFGVPTSDLAQSRLIQLVDETLHVFNEKPFEYYNVEPVDQTETVGNRLDSLVATLRNKYTNVNLIRNNNSVIIDIHGEQGGLVA
jgi:hypothetical protein